MRESTKTALAVVAVVAIAAGFWLLLLSPKRDQVGELNEQTRHLQTEVSTERAKVTSALAAKRGFSGDYRKLVVLGKSVPAEAGTPSLLVQLNGVGAESATSFEGIVQASGSGEEAGVLAEATNATPSLVPLGASVGPAGLLAMPYTLEFSGSFFAIANFIHNLDSLVETKNGQVDAKGRLVTIDGFNLAPMEKDGEASGPDGLLKASFGVTTYVTPPGQGLTAGASASGPAGVTE